MNLWTALLDVLILLAAAMLLGGLCELLKQSAILGYLLAGILLGPNALNWMPNHKAVATIAELGVALLLFTIGLEFSWRRLRALGRTAVVGGTLQILVTGLLTVGCCIPLGLSGRTSVVLGAIVALSSTACVLRLLVDRAEIDSVYGRNALGILLLQDVAVVPLVLMVTILAGEGSAETLWWEIGRSIGLAALLVGLFYVVFNYVVPRLLSVRQVVRNRDLPILMAMTTAIGASWLAHEVRLSPALGAFVAGILLAESPFATQIRADVSSLRALFVTLFFSSVGMLADPAWAVQNVGVLLAVVAAILVGKTLVTSAVTRCLNPSTPHAFATGICLAQVGEFSIVLALVAQNGALLDHNLSNLVVSAAIATLFLTPYLVGLAPHAIRMFAATGRGKSGIAQSEVTADASDAVKNRIVIVGFGPAGQCVTEVLMKEHQSDMVVLELNRRSASVAKGLGLRTYIADATSPGVLDHIGIATAEVVVVTVPDPTSALRITELVRSLAPNAVIIVRARYHIRRWELALAGATVIVDEEEQVGRRIADEVNKQFE
ncbi:MAG: cation:proton antiporter [Phycisphaerales bacterium]|nr:cation:proton antiporter [Phycisphaerales bacterium]